MRMIRSKTCWKLYGKPPNSEKKVDREGTLSKPQMRKM